MSGTSLSFQNIWKKFRKGERHESLRDLIPSIIRRSFTVRHQDNLKDMEFWALQDVSFELNRGETLGIIGSNGAGKSTILKLLSGILKPNKGQMRVNGRLSSLIEVGAGFHEELTGRENIYLNGSILGMRKTEITRKLEEIVEFSGLKDFLDTPVKRFSSGMYARLGFSVAAHVNPDILLVDEVLSVGDMEFQQRCIEKMISIRNNGTTIIFVSHNLESVNILCHETILLEGGKIKKHGITSEVVKEYVLSARKFEEEINQEANINNVVLLNNQNQPQEYFVPGERAKIYLEIKCLRPKNECLLGFIVNRVTDGITVCDYNLALGLNSDDKVYNVYLPFRVEFDVNLLRGAYTISFHILHYPTGKFIFKARTMLSFNVEERISWRGISHLNPVLNSK